MDLRSICGDMSRLAAVLLLLFKIYRKKSCAGVSDRTQILILMVYCTLYLDLFANYISIYDITVKMLFVAFWLATIYLIYIKFKDACHQRENFRIESIVVPLVPLSLLLNHEFSFMEVLWIFSIYLEYLSVRPQLTMVMKIGKIESSIFYYICVHCSYIAFFIINWIERYYEESFYENIATVAGCIQTLVFLPFFYLYYNRVINKAK